MAKKGTIELNGKTYETTILEPHELFTDGHEGLRKFTEHMKNVRQDFQRKSRMSEQMLWDKILR